MINTLESTPTLLALCTLILFLNGLIVFSGGKSLSGKGTWLIWAGLLLLLGGIGFDAGFFLREAFKVKVWISGWIWPREDVGAITVGVLQDPIGLAMGGLASFVSMAFLLNQGVLTHEKSTEKTYASLAVSSAGVMLAWSSITPWLSFAGLGLTLIGGIMAFGSHWGTHLEANNVARFAWERSSGFLIAFFGACILATSRTALLLGPESVWAIPPEHLSSTWVGSVFLLIGLFIQTQPFPFLGSLVSESEVYPPVRVLLNQIFPSWAAFSLILRLYPHFVNLGLFPLFGWVSLGSGLLLILSGLVQNHWRQCLGVWLAAGFSLSITFLAWSGPFAGLALLIGSSLGALTIAGAGSLIEGESPQTATHRKRATWLKIATFLGAAAGTGMVGFISATGGIRWMAQAFRLPGIVAPFFFVFSLFVFLGWRLSWKVARLQTGSSASWLSIFSVFIWIFLSLGIVWTGTPSGEIIPGNPDRLFISVFDQLFGAQSEFIYQEDYFTASSIYCGALIFIFLIAFWTSGRKEDHWVRLSSVFPRATHFVASGYGVDLLAIRMLSGLAWLGSSTQRLIDIKIWTEWIPQCLHFTSTSTARILSEFDQKVSSSLGEILRKAIEVPAKILQLIQTGDLRWYLVFALGSGFALLSHYLRT